MEEYLLIKKKHTMPFLTQGKTNWKFILIVIILAVIFTGFCWWGLTHIFLEPWDMEEILIKVKQTKEKGCFDSGGKVSTSSCCKLTNDFPNSCLIGACGCSPTDSHEVKTCDCGIDKCFDGEKCVSQEVIGDETANWKTYKNEQYGFEIKYPETNGISFFKIIVDSEREFLFGTIVCMEGEEATVLGKIRLSPHIEVAASSFEELGRQPTEEECDTLTTRYVVSGRFCTNKNLTQYQDYCEEGSETSDYHRYDVFLACDGESFGGKTGRVKCNQFFNQILSTFKFIEVSSSDFKVIGTDNETGWNVGRSDNYGFEIKYPSINLILIEEYIGPSVVAYLKMINESDQTEGNLFILVNSATSSDKCDGPSQIYEVEGFPVTSSALIGPVIFTRIDYYSDAIDLNRDYTIFRNGFCYNIHLVAYPYSCISSGCGDRRWSEVTFQAMLNNFDSIVNTFRFISQ